MRVRKHNPDGSLISEVGTPEPSPKYYISSEDLFDLFTVTEKEALADSDNSKVKLFTLTLSVRKYIRAGSILQQIINALEDPAGILGSGRAAEIIANGMALRVPEEIVLGGR